MITMWSSFAFTLFSATTFIWLAFIAGACFAAAAYLNELKRRKSGNIEGVLISLEIPRTNDKKELAAEQMFASLHGILRSKKELTAEGATQEHISFEIAAIDKHIRFYVWVPKHLQNFVEGQIYAQYPTVQIHTLTEDYAQRAINHRAVMCTELALTDNETLPLKTFVSFEVDPLAAITATLAKLEQSDEEMWIQVLARPIDDSWHKRGAKVIAKIKSGKGVLGFSGGNAGAYISQVLAAPFKAPEDTGSSGGAKPEVSERDRARITAIEEKGQKLGYQVKVRLAYLGSDDYTAKLRLQAMVGTFKQFNTTNLNGFQQGPLQVGVEGLELYRQRNFSNQGFILNIEELASLYHLPHTTVETPHIVWATSKTSEPPGNLPTPANTDAKDISLFGITNFRGGNLQFGIRRQDRSRHLYIIGQTGVGKSGLLELLTLTDVFQNQGFAIIDPHGDYAQNIMRYIPSSRVDDVVYFNPADTNFPVGFNPLEVQDQSLKNHISSEIVGVLKRMFESWGPRLEYILRYTLLALLDYPNSTMLDITRMLTEKDFRNDVISHIDDPVVKNFWTVEFASWNEKFASEAVAPVLNKVGAFTANPMIRNIVGQPKSTMNIRQIMDEGKILLVNLSRGLVGEDNAAILGALMVTKIQLSAMSRADIANIEDRRPFYLYVDEFQNFATDSFATILSEARKYALNLTVANQYTSQMEQVVRDAVFGNVGAIVSFRVGADDAGVLTKWFEPQFEAQDLIQLHNRNFVASMTINGEKTPAFSGTTLNIPPTQEDNSADIIELSRTRYAQTKTVVEDIIRNATVSKKPTHALSANQSNPPRHNNNRPMPLTPSEQGSTHSRAAKETRSPHVTDDKAIEKQRTIQNTNIKHSAESIHTPNDPKETPKKRTRRGKRSADKITDTKQGSKKDPKQSDNELKDDNVIHIAR